MGGRVRAVVEALVDHVDREVERRGVGDALRVDEPVEVGGGRRREGARQVARHDLRGALVEELGLRVGLDRHHAGILRQPGHVGGRQRAVVGAQPTDPHRRTAGGRAGLGGLVARLLAPAAGDRRHREQARAARPVLQLVPRREDAHRPHRRMAALQGRQAVQRAPARVNDIGVLGLVGDHPSPGQAQALEPCLLRRPDELDQRERLVAVGRLLGGKRGPLGARIDLAGGRLDDAHVVAPLAAGATQALLVATLCLDQREGLVAGDHPDVAAGEDSRCVGGCGHQQEVASGVRALRLRGREDDSGQAGQQACSDDERNEARDDYARPFHPERPVRE
jgi:hypothetical protein